ncbi:DUF5654 family protein [Candidatus Uabimicrobium sp. HlEnr_7]|uniref:DUF5654 family protein n=1 Tax=Candidatus Uabimicrobium helgolandensis TaxID=3095367 RepID=UPI003555E228
MKEQIVEKMAILVTSAFGLVAALAWNDAIKKIFEQYYPNRGEGISAQIVYAVIVTVIAVFAAVLVGRAAGKEKEKSS